MKRLALAAGVMAAVSLSACTSTSNDYVVENGLCYRVRTQRTAGVQVRSEKVLALPENCGLPPIDRTPAVGR